MLERLKNGDNPKTVDINKIDSWVLLHGMGTSFMLQRVATDIGNYIGSYMDSDPQFYRCMERFFTYKSVNTIECTY